MSTIDDAWRAILSREARNTLVKILKNNLIDILKQAERLDFIELEEDEVKKIENLNELPKIRSEYRRSHGQDGKSLRFIRREFEDHARGLKSHSRIDQKNARMILNRIDVFSNAAEMLVYFRNANAHQDDPIDDPGHAAALAGLVQHMLEQSVHLRDQEAKISIETLRTYALDTLRLCHSFYEAERKEEIDAGPMTSESALTVEEEENREVDIVVEKIEEFRSEWKKDVRTLLGRTLDEERLRVLFSDSFERILDTTLRRSDSEPDARKDDSEVFPEFSDEEESPHFELTVSPSLTPIQAENRLIALRNRISDEFRWNNAPIKPWENVLQRPLIEQIIQEKIQNVEQWKNAGGKIKERYTDRRNSSEAMDEQLRKYGGEMFDIIESIEDIPF